ncbi:unnamed protein product, partial [Prorocentrum cordatum]
EPAGVPARAEGHSGLGDLPRRGREQAGPVGRGPREEEARGADGGRRGQAAAAGGRLQQRARGPALAPAVQGRRRGRRRGRALAGRPRADEGDQGRGRDPGPGHRDMMDPDWSMNNLIHGGPGLHSGKTVAEEVSMYETEAWKKTTLANPNRTQKRKHQINWLAQEAIDKEAEMLDRQANGRMSKGQTAMKYGW